MWRWDRHSARPALRNARMASPPEHALALRSAGVRVARRRRQRSGASENGVDVGAPRG